VQVKRNRKFRKREKHTLKQRKRLHTRERRRRKDIFSL